MKYIIQVLMFLSMNCVQVPQYTSGQDSSIYYNSGHPLQDQSTPLRYKDCPVSFSFTFTSNPQIMFAISLLDMDGSANGYSAVAQSVTQTGFVIRYSAYTSALIYSIYSFWYAILDDMVTIQAATIPSTSFNNYVISFSNIQPAAPVVLIFMNGLQFSVKTSFVFTLGTPLTNQVTLTVTVSNGSVISQVLFNIIYAQSTYLTGGFTSMTTSTSIPLPNLDGYTKFSGQGLSGLYTTGSTLRIIGTVTVSGSTSSVVYSSWGATTLINYQVSYFAYKPCAKYCVSCLTTGPTYCTACVVSTQRNTDPMCTNCNYGYYMPSNEQGCITCSSYCDGCLSPTGNCVSCLPSTFRIHTPLCTDCPTSYYAQIGNIVCQQCNSNCYQCTSSATYCTACQPLSYRTVDSSQKCSCTTGYFEQNNECQQCDSSCLACSGPYYGCNKCQQSCSKCSVGRCQGCSKGYYLNAFHQCQPFCGDQIVVSSEQCDDGNQFPFDGCFQCQYSCNQYCQVCANNICMSCQIGYYLSSTNQCESICGDGIVSSKEQCDDKILNQAFGCHNCQLVCDSNCAVCSYGECKICQAPYQINSLNQCQNICGDLIVFGTEKCDDGNSYPFDGCFQCQYACNTNCNFCANGICMNCQSGYYLSVINQCESICGDGIVSSQEQCDDQLLNQPYGCQNCQLVCDSICLNCSYGRCTSCQAGYLVNSLNKCQTKAPSKFHTHTLQSKLEFQIIQFTNDQFNSFYLLFNIQLFVRSLCTRLRQFSIRII